MQSSQTPPGSAQALVLQNGANGWCPDAKNSPESQGSGMENAGNDSPGESEEDTPLSPPLAWLSPGDHMDIMRGVEFEGEGGGHLADPNPPVQIMPGG